jgi:D-alanine-D-alanine ligase
MGSTRVAGTSDRLRLGIVFGGTGPEHEASLSSARDVMDGLDSDTYQIEQFGIAKSGEWLMGPSAWNELLTAAEPSLLPTAIRGRLGSHRGASARAEVLPVPDLLRLSSLDCIFPIVDGIGGEDGSLQGLLLYTGRPVVGSQLLAAAQAYNKWTTKQLAIAAGIPSARGLVVDRQTSHSDLRAMVDAQFGHWDLFVKPVSCGSSFGVSRIRSEAEVDHALQDALAYDRYALIEEYIEHTEIFVGVLEQRGGLLIAPSVSEKPGKLGFSTYNDKYISVEESLRCPSVLDSELDREVRGLAGKVFNALGCAGFARVDFFLSSRDGRLIFNEINTMPAMARDCAFPTAMQKTGMTYPQLLEKIVLHAIDMKCDSLAVRTSNGADSGYDHASGSSSQMSLAENAAGP